MGSGRTWFGVESMTGFCASGVESLAFAKYMRIALSISFHEFGSLLNLYTSKWAQLTFLLHFSIFLS
jgi:hypothetical protein